MRERGFTLIELLVAMVLLAVVMAGIVSAVMNLVEGNTDAVANRAGQQQALDAMEQLRADVRVARSPAMDQWTGRREELRQLVFFQTDAGGAVTPSRAICSGVSYLNCIRDVTVASSTQLWFRADVRQGAGWNGSECVGYQMEAGPNAGERSLVRYVSTNWQACGPGVGGSSSRLLTAKQRPGAPASELNNIFSYTLRFHPGLTPATAATLDPAGCTTTTGVAAPAANRLNTITSVDVNLSGVATRGDQAAAAGLRTSLPITGRVAGDYAYAVGCSF